jgi:hypothetical protein
MMITKSCARRRSPAVNSRHFLFALALTGFTVISSAGTISGFVRTDEDHPLARVLVIAHLQPSAGQNAYAAQARTAVDGSFSISSLPKGRFKLCVQGATGYLDPCGWGQTAPSADLTLTEPYVLPVITLKKGRLLQLHFVKDRKEGATEQGEPLGLLVGVFREDGLFVRIPQKANNARERVHAEYVPIEVALQLSVTSANYRIADETGVNVDGAAGLIKRIEVPPGDQPMVLNFHISAKDN